MALRAGVAARLHISVINSPATSDCRTPTSRDEPRAQRVLVQRVSASQAVTSGSLAHRLPPAPFRCRGQCATRRSVARCDSSTQVDQQPAAAGLDPRRGSAGGSPANGRVAPDNRDFANAAASMPGDGSSGNGVAVLARPEARWQEEQPDKGGARELGAGASEGRGLGIVEFLRGKHVLVTGATGFLAKALVEKILREQPDVGRLYLFIQPRADQPAEQRLAQLVGSPIFAHVRAQHGTAYERFMAAKLRAVEGDISREGLGVSAAVREELSSKVQVLVNSAATTTFDERYDVALNINTQGPRRLLDLADSCRNLQLLLHISTAFVNGKRRGRSMERAFEYGATIAAELQHAQAGAGGAQVRVDVATEIALAEHERAAAQATAEAAGLSGEDVQAAVQKHMVELGMRRAQQCGWQDTYVFTKAMGEMVLTRARTHLPLAIVRPSIVESCLREPMAGWMEGMRMADPILLAYGKGQMAGFLANPDGVLDMVPCDMVINAVLAIATHTASVGPGAPVAVYHVATSVANPLGIQVVADATSDHFAVAPMLQRDGSAVAVQRMQVFRHPRLFMLDVWLKYQLPLQLAKLSPWSSSLSERRNNLLLKTAQQLSYLAKLYEPYTFYAARFDASNTERLFSLMSEEEQRQFDFDLRAIDWHSYLCDVHLPGLRKYVLKGRGSSNLS
ncbi:hypothetical protein CLOM_g11113 [Closterium sp. NIES-68]|nr:hypothetical protein CLOM_g11113 [Closterium sp. NIES-68]GJP75281.1 hypothetical protein CLOP_g5736 [Closterium sp. NIES-67]